MFWCLFFFFLLRLFDFFFPREKKSQHNKTKQIARPACRKVHLSWIMYQDYSGNYDTSSRGSSTSPVQPDSFTSGSSTIGSPISTSSYQVPQKHRAFHPSIQLCVSFRKPAFVLLPRPLSFRNSPGRLGGNEEPSDTNSICFSVDGFVDSETTSSAARAYARVFLTRTHKSVRI